MCTAAQCARMGARATTTKRRIGADNASLEYAGFVSRPTAVRRTCSTTCLSKPDSFPPHQVSSPALTLPAVLYRPGALRPVVFIWAFVACTVTFLACDSITHWATVDLVACDSITHHCSQTIAVAGFPLKQIRWLPQEAQAFWKRRRHLMNGTTKQRRCER
jgi:hypothetical protein